MDFHPAANIFPLMTDEAMDELVEDISKNGLLEPIEIFEGKILDGRNRWTACTLARVTPRTVEVNPEDEGAYVLSKNLHRRHLTTGQRAMIGESLREYEAERAKERQRGGQGGVLLKDKKSEAKLSTGQSRELAGIKVGVSGQSVDRARKVKQKGSPELVKAVEAGEITLGSAERALSAPEDQQLELAKAKRSPKPVDLGPPNGTPKSRGVGVRYGNAAIDALKKIPKNDALRARGFQIVTDWIKHNK